MMDRHLIYPPGWEKRKKGGDWDADPSLKGYVCSLSVPDLLAHTCGHSGNPFLYREQPSSLILRTSLNSGWTRGRNDGQPQLRSRRRKEKCKKRLLEGNSLEKIWAFLETKEGAWNVMLLHTKRQDILEVGPEGECEDWALEMQSAIGQGLQRNEAYDLQRKRLAYHW
jgi:hypothetical protein